MQKRKVSGHLNYNRKKKENYLITWIPVTATRIMRHEDHVKTFFWKG